MEHLDTVRRISCVLPYIHLQLTVFPFHRYECLPGCLDRPGKVVGTGYYDMVMASRNHDSIADCLLLPIDLDSRLVSVCVCVGVFYCSNPVCVEQRYTLVSLTMMEDGWM